MAFAVSLGARERGERDDEGEPGSSRFRLQHNKILIDLPLEARAISRPCAMGRRAFGVGREFAPADPGGNDRRISSVRHMARRFNPAPSIDVGERRTRLIGKQPRFGQKIRTGPGRRFAARHWREGEKRRWRRGPAKVVDATGSETRAQDRRGSPVESGIFFQARRASPISNQPGLIILTFGLGASPPGSRLKGSGSQERSDLNQTVVPTDAKYPKKNRSKRKRQYRNQIRRHG